MCVHCDRLWTNIMLRVPLTHGALAWLEVLLTVKEFVWASLTVNIWDIWLVSSNITSDCIFAWTQTAFLFIVALISLGGIKGHCSGGIKGHYSLFTYIWFTQLSITLHFLKVPIRSHNFDILIGTWEWKERNETWQYQILILKFFGKRDEQVLEYAAKREKARWLSEKK